MVMKPYLLHAHTKPITWLKYNTEGDLLFVSSKDFLTTVWYTETAEILGSFKHEAAVNCIDVNYSSTRVATAVATGSAYIWNVNNGKPVFQIQQKQPLRVTQFSEGDAMLLTCAERYVGAKHHIAVYDLPEEVFHDDVQGSAQTNPKPKIKIELESRINCAMWGPLNKTILCCCEDGTIRSFDTETQMEIANQKHHRSDVNKISLSYDKTMLISASSDNTATLMETKTLELVKRYQSTEPLNTAAISPLKYHVALGGGVPATSVTTTLKKDSTFDIHFHHMIFEDELGKVKGHFGPVHLVQFSPDGKGFTSGGEDGIVRMHRFDKEYLNQKDEL